MAQVFFEDMPAGVQGRTDGENVFLDTGLSAEQMMCTLMHELIHIERGHSTRQLEPSEMSVRYETARRLLPLDRLAGACHVGPLSKVARRLGVTKRVLMDRAATLTDQEASDAGCWDCQKCPAIAARASQMVPC